MKVKTHISLLSAQVLALDFFLRSRPSLMMLALGVLASIPSHAETLLWTNTSGGNWNAAANWEPNQVPGVSDNAVITAAGTYTVTLNADVNVASLTCGGPSGTQTLSINGATLTLDGASLAKSNAVINFNGGAIAGAGELVVEGLFLWTGGTLASTGGVTANGTLVIGNAIERDLSGVLRNDGEGRWDAGTIRHTYAGGSALVEMTFIQSLGHEWPTNYDRSVLDWLLALPADPTIHQDGPRVVITYPSGTLQSAWNVTGPWTDVEGATSPHSTLRLPSERYSRTRR